MPCLLRNPFLLAAAGRRRVAMLASRSERLRRERKADEKVERFNRMMDLCASAEDLHGTERIFQRLVRDKQEPNDLSLALLVAASAEAREIVRAEMWLRRFMRAKLGEIRQHPRVTRSLIAAGARSMVEEEEDSSAVRRFSSLVATSKGDLDDTKLQKLEESFAAALKECQPMSSVTKHLYEELLQCLAGLGKKAQIQSRLQEMAKLGVPANTLTYGIIVNALRPTEQDLLFASQLFQQVEESGLMPSLPLFNAMLKVCARAADLDRAKSWFQKIYDASLQPNILSFNNLLGACTMFGSVSEARAVLERMTKAQVSPDSFSYLWMIKVSGRRGGKAAEACLEEARHQELKLDTGMYNAVFRAYLAEEETPETPKNVKRLFEQMELDEIRADGMSLSSLAYAYAMQNEVERAEDLIFQARQESGRQRPEFFACLLFAYARKRGSRSRKAERAFRDLVDSGLAPTPAMLRYLRMAMPTEAEQLMAELGVSEKSVCVGGGEELVKPIA
ncbi:unnamed protein product [Durusdinium trenchii]|uniref:PROP1-like PPR domain-containing protein n=1 Tax=Durusdinium trenchii TaxID=1381693 RepID=A0ABP0P1L0_9DINO